MIEDKVIQEIKDRLDIVEVVGDFVSLKKSGSSYKALSPFTTEKTPSFFVSPSKQIFKCFSTGKGGDAIEFLKEVDSMTYIEAIKYLGEKYGVEINESESNYVVNTEKESLLIVLNKTKEFFKENLNSSDGKSIAISYFDHRNISKEMVEKFELGYSLDKWDSLYNHLIKNQFEDNQIINAGLILENNNKKYDRFRNRIIFPIHNLSGKVIAFGARIIKDEKNQPKYINSPETSLYIKSKVLYGLYQSKNNIRKEDTCYLVEGYTDVISLFQIEINNVVSSSGTSLTNEQIKLISRYTKNITILFDGDKAGIDASLRGMDLILENDMNVKIVSFPEGEDPDSYSKKVGKDKFLEFIKLNETNLINYKINLLNTKYKDDPVKKSEMIFDIVRSISKIPNSIKRSVFLKEASNLLDINEQALISEMNKLLIGKENKFSPTNNLIKEEKKEDNKTITSAINFYERECVRMLVNYGTTDFEVIGLDRKSFIDYFLNEIEDVEFENKNYLEIIEVFKREFKKDKIIDINYFLTDEFAALKDDIIDLSANKYEISKQWRDKFNIHVSEETDSLKKTTYTNILRLKFRLIRKMINDNMQNLNTSDKVNIDEETIKLHNKLKSAEIDIAKKLGNVTSV
ncbi:MAG: DNA primase [Flammeovirgaceae bacterium]|nr:DNA primase [Flammeovirgaceae bacterium]MEC8702496.1 DNA primase [Bacteroidota bacterium]|tara:strand:+ start:4525 stop:6414 length:1890 start_codon:yes stop_codon:yes gene_type:complete